MKTAIYPGTFDPITFGHIDVIRKSLKLFDRLVVATTDNVNKNYFFSIDERLSIIKNSLFNDLKINKKKIKVISFDTLTINLCKKYKASTIIRGLRAVSDFEYEFQLAGMNKKLDSKIDTIFLMSDVENQIISSKFVKEIANLNGNINKFVTKSTVKILRNKNMIKKIVYLFILYFSLLNSVLTAENEIMILKLKNGDVEIEALS